MLSGLPFAYTLSGYAFGCIRYGIAVTHTLRKAHRQGYTGYAFAFADTRAGGGARGGNPHYIYVYAFRIAFTLDVPFALSPRRSV
jgi:hypothetical protein